MSLVYLAALLVSFAGVAVIDLRHRLFFAQGARRALVTVAVGFVVLLVVDIVAILCGLFLIGSSPYMTGITIAPHMPIEEPLFLLFLSYLTMVLHALVARVQDRLRDRRTARG